jgi:hypothetical protein
MAPDPMMSRGKSLVNALGPMPISEPVEVIRKNASSLID